VVAGQSGGEDVVIGEPRWHMASAVVAAIIPAAERRRGRTGRRPATSTSRSPADEPSLTVAHWRPRFIDYLYLGFTNATAFSPTDAMPLAPWAKITMTVQALISLVILGLVIARAVNVFA
jgi:hypothetical protein